MKTKINENSQIINTAFDKIIENNKHIKTVETKMAGIGINIQDEKYEVTRIVVVAIIMPMLTALSIILRDWLNTGLWNFTPMAYAAEVSSIPIIISWLNKKYNKKELNNERRASARQEEYNQKLNQVKDELNAERINAGLARKELELLKEKEL